VIRLLHVADVHLGASYSAFGPYAEARADEVLDAFRLLPELAARHDVHAVVVAGDLFDSAHPPTQLVAAVTEVFRRLKAAGRHVFVVPGNHDALYSNRALYEGDLGGIHLFRHPTFDDPVCVEAGGSTLAVYGIAYDWAREAHPLSTFRRADIAGTHVVVLHGSVPDSPHWHEGSALRLPIEELRGIEADYIALGDHHGFRPPARFGSVDASVCYSGSFAAVDLTETGPRGYTVVTLEPGEAPRLEHHSSRVRSVEPLGELDVGQCSSDEEILDRVRQLAGEGTIPVVTLTGEPPFAPDLDFLITHLCERFGHAVVRDETRFYASETFQRLATEPTIVGHVARLGLRRIEDAPDEVERSCAERALRLALNALEPVP
jgi:DNA repair exonuclease SbcCD nuclease subunit